MRKFTEVGDEVYALLNWQSRQSSDDSVILKCLAPDEVATYRRHGEQGLSDTEIFWLMFPKPPPAARQPSTKFSRLGERFLAIMNWRDRMSENDVAAMRYLDSDETATYVRLHEQGLSDTEIFGRMFPEKALPAIREARVVEIDLSQLTKRHLVHLIEAKLEVSMPSLERSLRDDLEKLLMKLYKSV